MTRMPLARAARLLGTLTLGAGFAAVLAAAAGPGPALAQGEPDELDFCNERCLELEGECHADCDAGDDECTESCRADRYACRRECNADEDEVGERPASPDEQESQERESEEPADPTESPETGQPPRADDERQTDRTAVRRPEAVDEGDPAERNRRLPK